MAIGKFRCIVMNVTDLERGEPDYDVAEKSGTP